MGVSKNNGTPQIIHFNRVFHYKPSILGTPIFGNIHIMYIEYAGISHQVNTVLKEKSLLYVAIESAKSLKTGGLGDLDSGILYFVTVVLIGSKL